MLCAWKWTEKKHQTIKKNVVEWIAPLPKGWVAKKKWYVCAWKWKDALQKQKTKKNAVYNPTRAELAKEEMKSAFWDLEKGIIDRIEYPAL